MIVSANPKNCVIISFVLLANPLTNFCNCSGFSLIISEIALVKLVKKSNKPALAISSLMFFIELKNLFVAPSNVFAKALLAKPNCPLAPNTFKNSCTAVFGSLLIPSVKPNIFSKPRLFNSLVPSIPLIDRLLNSLATVSSGMFKAIEAFWIAVNESISLSLFLVNANIALADCSILSAGSGELAKRVWAGK